MTPINPGDTPDEQEKISTYPPSLNVNIVEGDKSSAVPLGEDNIAKSLSAFERAFRQIFVWLEYGDGSGEWRVHKRYRRLFSYLTPRQIKAFLRGRLLSPTPISTRITSLNTNDDTPELVLLRTLFHPVWKLHRDANDLFMMLARAAKSVLHSSRQARNDGDDYDKLSRHAIKHFLQHFEFVVQVSDGTLTSEDVKACWPDKNEERAALLHLLELLAEEENASISLSGSVTAAPPPPVRVEPAEAGDSTLPQAQDGTDSSESSPPPTNLSESSPPPSPPSTSFANWVFRELGIELRRGSVSEQVSFFQDIALAKYHQGERGVLDSVTEYARTYLRFHAPSFDRSVASSLSNLAVLIDDYSGSEKECYDLFDAAVKQAKNKQGSRIPLFYAEFLLDVLDDPDRSARLKDKLRQDKHRPIISEDPIRDTAVKVLKDNSSSVDLEPSDRFYVQTLLMRLNYIEGGDHSSQQQSNPIRIQRVWDELVRPYATVLISGGREPSSRLNDLLDVVIGTQTASVLRLKEPLQVAIWGAQIKHKKPGWVMAVQIANDLVGESRPNSEEEIAGMRLNGMLVTDEELLGANEDQRIAAIWRQSATLISQRQPAPISQSRAALAFLMSLAYGGAGLTIERMGRAWMQRNNVDGNGTEQDWRGKLTEEHREIAARIRGNEWNHSFVKEVGQAVFVAEYLPLTAPVDLVTALQWDKEAFRWAIPNEAEYNNKAFDDVAVMFDYVINCIPSVVS
ncbi:MAG: hypothetical protein LBI92_02220 [Azoarcus sp.]|jgi:hypothetical protein|nr:hypothetical protein [Azoarcus sp.]